MTSEDAKILLVTDPNFVYSKRFGYLIDNMINRYPDGCPVHVIANALLLTEDDVETMYRQIVQKLRALMGIDLSS